MNDAAPPTCCWPRSVVVCVALVGLVATAACRPDSSETRATAPTASATHGAMRDASASASASTKAGSSQDANLALGGSTIQRVAEPPALLVANEQHEALFSVALPMHLGGTSKPTRLELGGPPAQLVSFGREVLVTIRAPGSLVRIERKPNGEMTKIAELKLAADAWGLAVSTDRTRAYVTSAWSHTLTAIDLAAFKQSWTLDLKREPRGVRVTKDGSTIYVSHLVGSSLTVVTGALSATPKAERVDLPPARSRTPAGLAPRASLAYSLLLSPDEDRLFLPRLALGVAGATSPQSKSWFGAGTVDIMVTADRSPLAPPKSTGFVQRIADIDKDADYTSHPAIDDKHAPIPLSDVGGFVQPRAIVYRNRTKTLLVAAEGRSRLVELDALSLEPALHPLRYYSTVQRRNPRFGVAERGGSPSGIVLSEDEMTAYVFCHTTNDVVAVGLGDASLCERDACVPSRLLRATSTPTGLGNEAGERIVNLPHIQLARDALQPADDNDNSTKRRKNGAMLGRLLFYDASDDATSGGLACAGCHPDGRDDGHTWHELRGPRTPHDIFVGSGTPQGPGKARQTPMLAGRVKASGPYGWQAESPTLIARIEAGFKLHRWDPPDDPPHDGNLKQRAASLAAFLRVGLVPPPEQPRDLSATEKRGQAVFNSAETGCSGCHTPSKGYTDLLAIHVGIPKRAGFVDEREAPFRTPSLRYVSHTPPYFHNGSVYTLERLIVDNKDRMGKTSHLSTNELAELIAFLKTL